MLTEQKTTGFLEWEAVADPQLAEELFQSNTFAINPQTDARIYFPKKVSPYGFTRGWYSIWEPNAGEPNREHFLFKVFAFPGEVIEKANQRYEVYLQAQAPALAC